VWLSWATYSCTDHAVPAVTSSDFLRTQLSALLCKLVVMALFVLCKLFFIVQKAK
jgi:hypothetical protein